MCLQDVVFLQSVLPGRPGDDRLVPSHHQVNVHDVMRQPRATFGRAAVKLVGTRRGDADVPRVRPMSSPNGLKTILAGCRIDANVFVEKVSGSPSGLPGSRGA